MGTVTWTLDDLSQPAPPPGPRDWNDDGFVILPGVLRDDLIDAYCDEWLTNHGGPLGSWWTDAEKGGWAHATPYTTNPALRALATQAEVSQAMEQLIGEPVGLHLNLTGWVSTERDWHQDGYLNPPGVDDWYVACWMALDDIKPDSGPFQLVAGSHRWFEVTRNLMFRALTPEERNSPHWPRYSERVLTPLFEAEIERRDAPVVTYLPKRGDVLFWHSRLLHRGSKPEVPGTQRRALISHYSGIHHRPDMPPAVRSGDGWVFPLTGWQPTR